MAMILIVDDEKSILLTMRAFLRAEGYQMDTAEDADTALAFLDANPIGVVVTDIGLPRKSGLELLASVRDKYPTLPVILMSGEPRNEAAIQGLLAKGAADFLAKPLSQAVLLRAVAKVIGQG